MSTTNVNLEADRSPHMRALLIVMAILPTIAIALRFWSRAIQPTKGTFPHFWWDDWAALLAAVSDIP